MAPFLKGIFAQPTVYFLVLGVGVFWLDRRLNDDSTIYVTASARADVERRLRAELGRAPSDAELEGGVELWRENEALYREGVKLGLLQQDSMMRAHLATKLRAIAAERVVVSEPTEQELRAYLQANGDALRTPALFDVEHVFLSRASTVAGGSETQGEAPSDAHRKSQRDAHTEAQLDAKNDELMHARTQAALARLGAGAEPQNVSDPFPRGTQFLDKTRAQLEQALGVDLNPMATDPKTGVWYTLHSKRGVHLLRLTRIDAGAPNFEKLRPALRLAVIAREKERQAQQFADEVQSQYRFEAEP
jgi:hypothetical protein